MEVYYLQKKQLEGPVNVEDLAQLLEAGVIREKTPAWSPTRAGWTSCATFLQNLTETALVQFDDPSIMATDAMANDINTGALPAPRNLLAIRLATEQELITPQQAERCLETLYQESDPEFEVIRWLHAHGWVTASQRGALDAAVSQGSVPKLLGGYEILDELGRGGMGTTYKARQISMDRLVALKVLLPKFSQDEAYIRRFEREARMAARLNHENIATAYEVGEVGGQYFLSMEYVEGETVDGILDREGRLPEPKAVDIIVQMCRALAHAHEHGLVHRDVSPRNIILTANGTAKLIDMGLTKSTDPNASAYTTVGVTVGTPAYISPEQALGRDDLDIRADIYSLGCVLYEMLAGDPPLEGDSVLETINNHINESVPPLKEECPDVSDRVCLVVAKMTALKPEDRYQTPVEVIEGFEADADTVRQGLRTHSRVPPVEEQLARWRIGEVGEIRLRIDWQEYVHMVAQRLEEHLQAAEVDPEFQGYAQTIFAELVANAFDHGCKGLAKGTITIRMELNDSFFRLEVEDPGPGFAAREMLDRIKKEPLNRERRRGIMQILQIADVFTYSPQGNRVKAVLYRKAEGSGVFSHESDDITYVEIKGKGDLALAETFRRWVENFETAKPLRMCLMVRTEWVSSMFVGTIGKLHTKVKEAGSAMAVWPEHQSCYRIMQQLGVTSFVRIYDSLDQAVLALRYASLGTGGTGEKKAVAGEDGAEAGASASEKNGGNGDRDESRSHGSGTRKNNRTPTHARRLPDTAPGFVAWIKRLWGK